MSNIVSHLNDLNINLQVRKKIILLIADKVNTFIKKLGIWIIHFKKKSFDTFDLTSNYIDKYISSKSPIFYFVLDTKKTYL